MVSRSSRHDRERFAVGGLRHLPPGSTSRTARLAIRSFAPGPRSCRLQPRFQQPLHGFLDRVGEVLDKSMSLGRRKFERLRAADSVGCYDLATPGRGAQPRHPPRVGRLPTAPEPHALDHLGTVERPPQIAKNEERNFAGPCGDGGKLPMTSAVWSSAGTPVPGSPCRAIVRASC